MEEDYQKALEVIFAYDYECSAFKHNNCGDHSEVLDGMPNSSIPLPPEFFMNPRCPPVPAAIEDTMAEAYLSEAVQELEKNTLARDQIGL